MGGGIFQISSNSLVVSLGLGNHLVIADAIRIERLPDAVSGVEIAPVDLRVSTSASDGDADDYLVRRNDEGDIEVLVNGSLTHSASPQSIRSVIIDGSAADDAVILDYSNGSLANVVINGGGETTGDSLRLIGGADEITHLLADAGATIEIDGKTISVQSVESTSEELTASDRTFALGDGNDALVISDSEAGDDNMTAVLVMTSSMAARAMTRSKVAATMM